MNKSELELEKDKTAAPEDYYERGEKYYWRDNYKKAIADYNKAVKKGLRTWDVFQERGGIWYRQFEKFGKALADYTKALELAESSQEKALTLSMRSGVHQKRGDVSAALADIQAAIEFDSENGLLYSARALIREAMGSTEAAEWDRAKSRLIEHAEKALNRQYRIDHGLDMENKTPAPAGDGYFDLETVAKDAYSFFTSLRGRLYAHKDKSIAELAGKEDFITLACILAREEDYEQLERYAAEGLPLNEIVPAYFQSFQPTPLYYITTREARSSMRDWVKILRWLAGHGADPNKAAGDGTTPLRNQCFRDGNYDVMKALLEADADPNRETILLDGSYQPLQFVSMLWQSEDVRAGLEPDEIASLEKRIALLREYGASIPIENPPAGEEEETFPIFDDWAEIGDWKFARDKYCTTLIIPGGTISIGVCAFAHCVSLQKIDLGRNLRYIGKYAFRKDNRPGEMAAITEVINRSAEPQKTTKYHFHNAGIEKAVLRVPAASFEMYKNAEGWKNFGSIIALEEEGALTTNGTNNTDTKTDEPTTVHIWIGTFDSEEALNEYANKSEYEWDYYGHLLGEDNYDEPPEEYGLAYGFCQDYGREGKQADFEKAPFSTESGPKSPPHMLYLGEFEIALPEPDTDGPYEGLV